jgi:hypothetical protein
MLTQLEEAVLEMLLDRKGEPFNAIREQVTYAIVTRREFTGAGFFTDLALPAEAPVRRDLLEIGLTP